MAGQNVSLPNPYNPQVAGPHTLFWSSGLSVVVCWRWCATVYVLENSLQQPTPNSAGPVFSWTRRWLPAISATVMVRFTVHHRRTLL